MLAALFHAGSALAGGPSVAPVNLKPPQQLLPRLQAALYSCEASLDIPHLN